MRDDGLIYGLVPALLRIDVAGACQCSPLFPGAALLEDMMEASAQRILMHAPAGTAERRFALAHALRVLKMEGTLTVFARGDKGGGRIAKELRSFHLNMQEEARAHHRICTATKTSDTCTEALAHALKEGALQCSYAHGLYSQPGIFSYDRIDAGSALLIEHLSALHGKVADLGCGYGVLSKHLLQSSMVTALEGYDIDARAVNASRMNVTDDRAKFFWVNLLTLQATGDYDAVVMNPPFHDGGVEDKSLGQRFIEQASAMLRTGGECWMVANTHLPYEAVLSQHFTHASVMAQAHGFKLIKAVK